MSNQGYYQQGPPPQQYGGPQYPQQAYQGGYQQQGPPQGYYQQGPPMGYQQQAPPPQRASGGGGDGCMGACLGALCCCELLECCDLCC